MVDVLGTWNKLTWAGELQTGITINNTPTDKSLGSITLPNIPNAVIQMVRLRFLALAYNNTTPVNISPTQYIQVQKGAGGWNNAIKIPSGTMGFNSGTNESGAIIISGDIDVSGTVDVFNQAYTIQWDEAKTNAAGNILFSAIVMEMDVWFTLDSGVEAKIDIIDTNVDDIETDTSDMQPRVVAIETDTNEMQGKLPSAFIMGSSDNLSYNGYIRDVQRATVLFDGEAVTDGSNTPTTFKTDLTGWGDDYFNNLQIVFYDPGVAPLGQARRITDYVSATGFITVSEALGTTPATGDKFKILSRYTGAGSALTPAAIATAVWSEILPGSFTGSQAGKIVADIGTRVLAFFNKLPSKSYLRGTGDSDGGMDTEDKADINAEADQALIDYDPPTRTEATSDKNEIIAEVDANEAKIDAIQVDVTSIEGKVDVIDGVVDDILLDTAAIDARLPSDPADQSLVEDKIDAAVDDLDGADNRDHTEIYDAVAAIQNNTRFTYSVPQWMQKPDSGDEAYRMSGNLMDTTGAMEDPDNSEILVRVLKDDGTPITDTLFKENALTNPLDAATDQVNFPSGSGWRAMERLGVGRYDFFYKVTSTATEEHLTIEFGWTEGGGNPISRYASTIISDVKGDIEDIQAKMDAVYVKTDSATPSPTIPAQITQHDTDIKALGRIEACPDWMYVPSGRSRINITGGISDTDTEIPVLDYTVFQTDGVVKIENEYIIYSGITDSKLQVTSRGAYGSSATAHNNNVVVNEVVVFPVRLVVFDNAGNMVDADSLPTVEIEDWNGTQELAPTAMTKIATGRYNYDYLITRGDLAENKVFIFSATVSTITQVKHIEVIINDEPASELSLADATAGGSGEFVCDQDGWYDNDGIKTAWGDVLEGIVEDADTGAPLDDAYVTAYLVVNGEVLYNGRPPGQARTRVNGTWLMFLDAATYQFVFQKDGFRIAADGTIQRTVG